MGTKNPWSWVPAGVLAALLLTLAVAWSFHDRSASATQCAVLYAAAETAVDSALVDAVVIPGAWKGPGLTCGELMRR